MRRLIANADDFGLTPGVNRSIVELTQNHALSSATLMATSHAFSEAVGMAQSTPQLGVGCHVVLVDGVCAADPSQIPTLASPDGQLRPTLGNFVRDLMLGRIRAEHIEAEAVAQITRLQQAGLTPTHLDTHKHTHLFPAVLRPVLRAAQRCGVPAIRNPFEPQWAIQATAQVAPHASALRRVEIAILNRNRSRFVRLVREAGLATTDGSIGVFATGVLNRKILSTLLRKMPPGSWELVCHPGYPDAELAAIRTKLRETRGVEHEALLTTLPAALDASPDLALIRFDEL